MRAAHGKEMMLALVWQRSLFLVHLHESAQALRYELLERLYVDAVLREHQTCEYHRQIGQLNPSIVLLKECANERMLGKPDTLG